MKEESVDVILREDGFYEVKMAFPKEKFKDLLRTGYGYEKNLEYLINQKFADLFVEKNFDQLSKLVDMDTIKLLVTRKLAGLVAKEGC